MPSEKRLTRDAAVIGRVLSTVFGASERRAQRFALFVFEDNDVAYTSNAERAEVLALLARWLHQAQQ